MAPLQKRALYGLRIGIVFAIALIVVFIAKGESLPLMKTWDLD